MTIEELWFERALLADGWARDVKIGVSGGRIASLETGAKRSGASFGAAIPGLPNLHSHAFQRGMAGLAEVRGPAGDSFWTWREAMYRFVDRMGPDDVEAIAALAYAEMLEGGFTRVGEFHYLHHAPDGRPYADRGEMAARIAAASEAAGIGLTLLPVFYAHSGFGGAEPTSGQRRFLHDISSFGALLERAREVVSELDGAVVGLAPHSLRAATPGELAELARLGAGAPIHIHIAEQVKEVEDCLAWSGQRPVEWLMSQAEVGSDWCLVHATHMTPDETAALARSGAVAGLCPITEANLGDGLFPAEAFLALGGRFGVGSDSNVLIDAAEELRTLEYGQRLTRRGRNLLAAQPGASTGGDLFRAAVAGGAQALGAEAGLSARPPAAGVALDLSHPPLFARDGDLLVDSWIFARGPVDAVWRGGRQVVSGGRHRDRDRIESRYREAMTRLIA